MRISDWSSDVCSSDLGRNDSLSLRNTGRVGNEYRRRLAPKLQYSLKAARLSANRLGISVPNPVGCRRSLAVHLGFDFLGGCDDFVEGWSLAEDHCLGCGIVAPQLLAHRLGRRAADTSFRRFGEVHGSASLGERGCWSG